MPRSSIAPARAETRIHPVIPDLHLPAKAHPIAVIDIGSNSGRVVVIDLDQHGHPDILADGRYPLRLARDILQHGSLSDAAMDRTMQALADFKRLAEGAGARRIVAVATSAMREAGNGERLARRIRRELKIPVHIVAGEGEAAFAFLGAVQSLPVDDGLVFDLGGGSLEVSRFARRRLVGTWTLPLGALRLTEMFLKSDPPSTAEIKKLRDHVRKSMRRARVPQLKPKERLVGTGGTIRNLAKLDRRQRIYPLGRLHGYSMTHGRVANLSARIASRKLAARAEMPGLNADRGDSIVGGVLCLDAAMTEVGAAEVLVSGYGLREGVALAAATRRLPSIAAVRKASVDSLVERFRTWDAEAAARREDLARRLLQSLDEERDPEVKAALLVAARALDIGRSVDYYNRHRHASSILAATDLSGFTQREVALIAAITQLAGEDEFALEAFRPLLRPEDEEAVHRAAAVLSLADEIEQRTPAGARPELKCRRANGEIWLRSEALRAWKPRSFADRFRRAFGRELKVGVQKGRGRW